MQTWRTGGKHVKYQPTLGYYSTISNQVINEHIVSMEYAKIDVAIASWWGQDTKYEVERMPLLLNHTNELKANLKWSFYYEKEMGRNPDVSKIKKDLAYLFDKYASNEAFAKIDGKPVIFVYNDGSYSSNGYCEVSHRWKRANSNGAWHVVLKVFKKYLECKHQPDSWRKYFFGANVNLF